jgi:predicted Fe-Mo cluster-binding NifX family protein
MKVGFAVQSHEGIESKVYDHFGSAPAFIIVDTEGKEVNKILESYYPENVQARDFHETKRAR